LIFSSNQQDFSLEKYLRQPFYVPETKKVNELFKAMKKEKIHMAIVLDEYGSTAGLVTMEDMIEEIMGDIQDEHDTEEPEFRKIDSQTAEISGSMRLDELNERLGLHLNSSKSETIGGLVFAALDRVPITKDRIVLDDVQFVVQKMDGHRIDKILLQRFNQ
jgi:CBS domain containing-hemolysin-like protein